MASRQDLSSTARCFPQAGLTSRAWNTESDMCLCRADTENQRRLNDRCIHPVIQDTRHNGGSRKQTSESCKNHNDTGSRR